MATTFRQLPPTAMTPRALLGAGHRDNVLAFMIDLDAFNGDIRTI